MITSKNPVSVSVPREGSASLYVDACSKTESGVLIMKEVWRDIPEYEGYYQVSNHGRVRSLDRVIIGGGVNPVKNLKGRIIKACPDLVGYLIVGLSKNGKVTIKSPARLVAIQFIPNPNNLPQVNHKDENKANNREDNLEWCTCLYNVRYGTGIIRRKIARTGVSNVNIRGEKNHFAKLKEVEVLLIFNDKRKRKEISREYGISCVTVSKIRHKKTWVHLLKNLN